jgi:parallel beta-helix repeat protein
VLMFGARRSVVSGLRIDSIGGHAIRVMGDSRYNRIVDNDVRDTELHGVALWQSHGNVIAGNEFVGSRDGVRLQSSSGNAVVNNRTVGSMIEGVDLHLSTSNTIILNDLLEPVAAPLLDDAPPGANTYGVRWGGNYVLRYDAESEGCTDVENDRRCDEPYRFYGHEAPSAMTSALTLDESSPEWDQASVWRSTIDRIADSEQPETICSGCHDFGNGEGADIGPPLQGIVGKQVASGAFEYSPGLSQLGGTWTRERLAAFIRNPQELAPGTTMSFPGIDDEAVIRAIVDYLAEGS